MKLEERRGISWLSEAEKARSNNKGGCFLLTDHELGDIVYDEGMAFEAPICPFPTYLRTHHGHTNYPRSPNLARPPTLHRMANTVGQMYSPCLCGLHCQPFC